jgi:hypothetical protein
MNCPQKFWGLELCFTVCSFILVALLLAERVKANKSNEIVSRKSLLPLRQQALAFCLQNSLALRYLMFIMIMFVLAGSIFAKHGVLVIESGGLTTLVAYLHKLCILFVLYRLIEPNDRQDLYGLFFLVVTSLFGGWKFGAETLCLYAVVLLGRWTDISRIISAFFYVLIVAPLLGMMFTCISIHGNVNDAIRHPDPYRTMDGIYHLTKSYQGVTLYREVELLPRVYMRKPIDYKTTGWPSWAHIRKKPDGTYDIEAKEPPPE